MTRRPIRRRQGRQRICPLRFSEPSHWECEEERCMWWIQERGAREGNCAVTEVALRLRDDSELEPSVPTRPPKGEGPAPPDPPGGTRPLP